MCDLVFLVIMILAGLLSLGTWVYILVASFNDGCLWPLFILLLGPIVILIYVLTTYKGSKATVLACFYAPGIIAILSSFFIGCH